MSKNKINIKEALQAIIFEQIESQLTTLHNTKISIEESKSNETKSSAGDKYETGRAMMQRELDKIETQLNLLLVTKNQLKQISSDLICKIVEIGAIVKTDNGNFYISVGSGKIMFSGENYYAISPLAPLSKIFMGKLKGDHLKFRDRKFQILHIE